MNLFFSVLLLSSTSIFGLTKSICITVIVREEEDHLLEVLEPLWEIADCVCISVQGNRRDPETFMYDGVRGQVFFHEKVGSPYVDAAQDGIDTLKKLGFRLNDSYLLLLEADQVCTVQGNLNSVPFSEDVYLLLEKCSQMGKYQYSPYLFRATLSASTIGTMRLHHLGQEVWEFPKLKSLMIEQGKRFLVESNHRDHLLQLANSQRELRKFDEAIETLKKIISLNQNLEDVWLSNYQIGECYEEKGEWGHAMDWYLEAAELNPHRAEPLFKVANHYRWEGKSDLAYLYAVKGGMIPHGDWNIYPRDLLYDYHFDEELSIASFYTPFKSVGYDACNRVILRKDTPSDKRLQAYKNILFYVENLKADYKPINISLPRIDSDREAYYVPMNPSIQKTEYGYKVICRTVNFTQQGAKHYHTLDRNGIIYTKNFLLHYDSNFNLFSQQEIVENSSRLRHRPDHLVKGLEDCRLLDWNGSTWFTCTTYDTSPTSLAQISLCKLPDRLEGAVLDVEKLIPLNGPDPSRDEKNWLPFIKDGEMHVVYSSNPLTIKKLDPATGQCHSVMEVDSEWDFSQFRGSAAPLPFDDGYLMLVHEVVFLSDYTRNYLHRFVFMDRDFKITKVTNPFTFFHKGVEYCLSMTQAGDQLVLPIGIEDKEAYFCFVNIEEVRKLLKPLPLIYSPF